MTQPGCLVFSLPPWTDTPRASFLGSSEEIILMVPNKCLGRELSAVRQSNNNGNGICISLEASVNFLESQRIYPPNSVSARFSRNSLYLLFFLRSTSWTKDCSGKHGTNHRLRQSHDAGICGPCLSALARWEDMCWLPFLTSCQCHCVGNI